MKKVIITLSICIFVAGATSGQNADREIFKEQYLYYRNAYSDENIKIGSDFKDFDGIIFLSACYADDKGQIRRFVNFEIYPEGTSYLSCVYDREGKLQRISITETEFDINAEYGTAFRQPGADIQEAVKYELYKAESYNDDTGKPLEKNHSGKSNDFQIFLRLTDGDYSGFLTSERAAKELAKDKYLAILHKSSTKKQGQSRMVIFDKPQVGDYTFVTANHVNIREKPDKKANVIIKAHTGYFVEVKKIITDENNELWYEIEFLTGGLRGYNKHKLYIYGDYLDNTAQEVKP